MTKDEARQLVLSEWLALPPTDRATETHAVIFALKAAGQYRWRAVGDRYQDIMDWIRDHIGKP
jgi:hypothetical protein